MNNNYVETTFNRMIAVREFVNPKWGVDLSNIKTKYGILKVASTTQKGDLVEDFLIALINKIGYEADTPRNKDGSRRRRGSWDVKVLNDLNILFEVKVATEDVGGGFQFNGLKQDTNWEYAFCLGVSPNELRYDIITRDQLKKYCVLPNGKQRKAMDSGSGIKYSRNKSDLTNIEEVLIKLENIINERLERIKK